VLLKRSLERRLEAHESGVLCRDRIVSSSARSSAYLDDQQSDEIGTAVSASLRARILAALFAAGATLALLTVALPHVRQADVAGVLATCATAYLVAFLLARLARTLPSGVLACVLAAGTGMITAVAYFSAEAPSPLIFFYLWVFLYSAYFFDMPTMLAQIAWVGVAYGVLLTVHPPASGTPAWWVVGMGTLAVAAAVIRVLRGRVDLLIARLYDASRSDPLTGLSNRRGFRELLDLELARARRAGKPLSVLIGDLDHFKEVNDRSGHQVGDLALQRVARVLQRAKRGIDGLGRIGGEEFALALPDTSEHDALLLAERLRCALQGEFESDPVPITVSFGAASHPAGGVTAASLLHAADEAMYAAKTSGRNRTVVHRPGVESSSPSAPNIPRDIAAERFLAVMLDLAEAVDLRFSGSARHSETVGRYAEMMARELGLSEQRTDRVRLAGLLHDIGKAGVPDAILRKPGTLTDAEFQTIRQHPGLGAQILQHPSLDDVREWVGAHHERPDGNGYPVGLAGEQIPLEARILAVADAFEAMTSDRSYRSSMSHERALAELERCAGTQFDERVVDALTEVLAGEADRAEAVLARL
jgi:diguanylate cyclase (GGDEF)-like protein/putative nucleotidyltransferase with HDIG domain